ncbi:hypothetical protein [Desulfovibrio sp. UCD-KL4C]|uniref:hypothetical protein n=1 Tax=Desulfovibrio sp. UCD-KL4C TaxID=2578120 RepID=UPI0025BE6AF3|nr:hypothetical protein [Desulfovibrio sp. UCD-KL4C]
MLTLAAFSPALETTTPPDIILIDKEISNSPRAMTKVERVMDFAEAMLAPAIIGMGGDFLEFKAGMN